MRRSGRTVRGCHAPDQRIEAAGEFAGNSCTRAAGDRLTSPAWVRRFLRLARRPPAQVAELVDALVSGTSGAIRGGSSPLLGTKYPQNVTKTAIQAASGRVASWIRAHFGGTVGGI